jgi:hypothetical protein
MSNLGAWIVAEALKNEANGLRPLLLAAVKSLKPLPIMGEPEARFAFQSPHYWGFGGQHRSDNSNQTKYRLKLQVQAY